MITFRYKNQTKRIKIKTQQRLDQRMSHWLQKVFNFKNSIIGFKTLDGKFFDVDSFYGMVDRFFGSTVDIIESSDQLEISFTSENLNSSSFIRPSQPSELNPQGPSSDDFQDFIFVSDRRSFESKLTDGKDISILFDTNIIYRKSLLQSSNQLLCPYLPFKTNLYLYVNNSHPKKSCYSIYIGKMCLVTLPLQKNYIEKVSSFVQRYKNSTVLMERENRLFMQARTSHQPEDEAPSFTTYHLQERLNQQACNDYLIKMNKEKLLRNYEFHKLCEKSEENFSEFYRIFCEGVMDNDYESFKNEILHKVENNLQLILSNVDEMDLSRPISREEQRRNNLKKSVPEIQIVKVENYFQILDQLSEISSDNVTEIKQLLLDEDKEISGLFSDYLSREISQETLTNKLIEAVAAKRSYNQLGRPSSRYVPSRPVKSKSVDAIKRKFSEYNYQDSPLNEQMMTPQHQNLEANLNIIVSNSAAEDPPMFGSIRNEENFSPIKYMSSSEENCFKYAWNKLSPMSEQFEHQEYGLLFHYLQTKDEQLYSHIQQLEWKEQECLQGLKGFLKQKIDQILHENFSEDELAHLRNNRNIQEVACIYENFRYESDLSNFITELKQELENNQPIFSVKTLHKKSSDSQLLDLKDKKNNRYGKRKFSDENQVKMDARSPSPKDSEYSLYLKNSQFPILIDSIRKQWSAEFEEMLQDINFTDERKEQNIREMYAAGSPEVFGWIRNYIKGQQQFFGAEQFQELKMKEAERSFLLKIFPIFEHFLAQFTDEGVMTEKVKKWLISEYLEPNMNVTGAFQLYLETKNEQQFIETLNLTYQLQNKDMEFYNTYIKRLESILRQMSVHDEVGLEVFELFPSSIKSLCELYFINGDVQDMIDTLDVLYKKQTELRELTVCTLNFSGINTSPFEYHDGSQEAEELDKLFKANLERRMPSITKWDIGKIDKDFQNKRQSICYAQGFRLNKDGKLPNRQQFESIWIENFAEAHFKKESPTEQQIAQCIELDYLTFLSVVQWVYKDEGLSNEDIQKQLQKYDPQKLISYLQQKKNQPQCKLQVKQQMIMNYLLKNSIDVLLLQEASCVDWGEELVKEYAWVKNADSVILYKKEKLGEVKHGMMEAYSKKLNFNGDSACLFTDKKYLLISSHLKSSKQHIEQTKEMFMTLEELLVEHPTLKLIVGIDANHFVDQKDCPEDLKLSTVPSQREVPTTTKKRTFLQAQMHKANEVVSEVKDLIITNRNINAYSIEDVNGKEISQEQQNFIPNANHPYDHFIVRADLN